MKRFGKREKGFTLIELMIAVIIIGVLAALAIPKYMRATNRAKQSEAQKILKQIYTMQRAYKQEFDTYCCDGSSASAGGSFATLGVVIMANARYTYAITSNATSFTATATTNLDDDPVIDTWTINEMGDIIHVLYD